MDLACHLISETMLERSAFHHFLGVIGVLIRRNHCFLCTLNDGIDGVFGKCVKELGRGGVRKVFSQRGEFGLSGLCPVIFFPFMERGKLGESVVLIVGVMVLGRM